MTDSDFQEFSGLLTNESQFYPQVASLTATKIRGYFESLSRFDLRAVKEAFTRLRERSEFFPTIRAIVEQCEGSIQDRAEMAWHTFFSLLNEGEYPSIWLYDKAMAYAVETLGGWLTIVNELREAKIEMIANFEKRFKAAYKIGTDRNESLQPRIHYAGLYEANNRQNLSNLGGWSDRVGAKALKLPVCIVSTDRYRRLDIPFDVQTMQIQERARMALESGGNDLRGYLPTPIAQPAALPPAGSCDEISEFERKQIIARIRSLAKPMPNPDHNQEPTDQVNIG